MEQKTLKEAAQAFAVAQAEESKARDRHTACQAALDKSLNDSVEASKYRRQAEEQLLKAATVAVTEGQQQGHTENQHGEWP
ncbi:hypothetical protein [Pseudomonas petrae]|uniref:Uncharacterized protein n=1 Tax=Pseudomonas petrae TaxID=2912190 RepID=A0ABS9IDI3_9PSED|nr:hypothetical protein [Pseudomonas petrae]MCF7545299.1 hypothetical protein [Pseudomonas petrae]